MLSNLILHRGEIPQMIGHQPQDPVWLELPGGNFQERNLHQATEPVASLRPWIGKGNMEGVEKSIGNQGIQ